MDKCPLCKSKVLYQGLNTLECAGYLKYCPNAQKPETAKTSPAMPAVKAEAEFDLDEFMLYLTTTGGVGITFTNVVSHEHRVIIACRRYPDGSCPMWTVQRHDGSTFRRWKDSMRLDITDNGWVPTNWTPRP